MSKNLSPNPLTYSFIHEWIKTMLELCQSVWRHGSESEKQGLNNKPTEKRSPLRFNQEKRLDLYRRHLHPDEVAREERRSEIHSQEELFSKLNFTLPQELMFQRHHVLSRL